LSNTKLPVKELSEKIPEGDCVKEARDILVQNDYADMCFDILPSLKDLQIPQALFKDLDLTVRDCKQQVLTLSLGIIKKAKVITFSEDNILSFVVNEGDYPGKLRIVNILDNIGDFGVIGNILKKKDI